MVRGTNPPRGGFGKNILAIRLPITQKSPRDVLLARSILAQPRLKISCKNQFRSAFPDNVPRILISDNDSVFRSAKNWLREVMDIRSHFTRIMSPWQNGVAERWVRTVRRELTDHVIPLSEQHLRTLLLEYVQHYNEDRTHTTLGLDSPAGREVHVRGSPSNVIRLPKCADCLRDTCTGVLREFLEGTPAGREVHARGSPDDVIRLPKVRGLSSRYVYRSAA